MNTSRIKMRHLHCLVVVAQERSMLKAAEVLALTQPAVSKTIAELEALVGRELLHRHPRGVDLTPAGSVLAEHAGASLRNLREGLDAAAGQPLVQQPSVSLGALPNVSVTLLPLALQSLRKRHPRLLVRVASGTNAQLMSRLRQGELDFVFGRLAEPADMMNLHFEHLFSEPLVAVVRPGHALARQRRLRPQALDGQDVILPTVGTVIRRTLDAWLVTRGVTLSGCVLETVDTTFAAQHLQRSDAVWFVPSSLAQGLHDVPVRALDLDMADTEGPVGITYRRDQELAGAAALMAEALRLQVARRKPGGRPTRG
ncbi:LysR family transcriptional regulator [Ramlibacter sp. AW1]|uniref:LysR family transcriptional regulator n=1 Tax=Ramlibacter aurantiacus TaxID=2801330 RepID=A0A937D520_9BURK|nr:LysR substrate-binding domain-containing protein [Ramlibacter aurantiacus]MBL0420892.1 LysR family transcriptional regulator [Ramlibacter aurantiacus]